MSTEDEILSGEILEPESATLFPDVGIDKTPTPEMIAKGRVGMGSWNLTDGSVEEAMAKRHEAVKERRDEREQFFNEKAKDGIADAIDLNHRIIKRGQTIMDKIEKADPDDRVTGTEMQILKMAQTASKELTDRAIGKSKQTSESKSTATSFEFLIETEL